MWIAWGALSLGVVAVALRPSPSGLVIRERRVEVPVKVEVPVEVPRIVVEKERIEPRTVVKEPAVAPPPVLAKRADTAMAHEKMLFLFERECDLRADQRRFMENILALREAEIAECQKGIVASGIFRVREYENQVKAMQNASYQKMAEVLNERQRERFTELVAEGRMGDAVVFEVPPTVVVLQD